MKTMIVVLVEGVSDQGAVRAVAKKLGIFIKVVIMRGNNLKKAVRIIRSYKDYDKAIILKDLHRYDENAITRRLETIATRIAKPKVIPIIVKRAIEAWVLADPQSLSKELGVRVNVKDSEALLDPAETLNHYMKLAGKEYIKSERMLEMLMSKVDLREAAKRARSLSAFIKALQDP